MNRWYSDRGAKRGLLGISVFAALWISWAIAFATGLAGPARPDERPLELSSAGHSANTPCKCDAHH